MCSKKKILNINYTYSSNAYVARRRNGRTQISEARTTDHGRIVDSEQCLDPRDSRNVSRKGPTGLHDYPDDRLSPGREKGRAARQEGRKLSHLRSRGFPQCCRAETDRRSLEAVRRTHATRNGTP